MIPDTWYLIDHPYHFTDHPWHLLIIPTIYSSSVPFYRPSITFTDHSYYFQSIRTILEIIPNVYKSSLQFTGHSYGITDHPWRLQIIPTVYRSSISFHRPSIAFTDHFYCFQVIHTVLQTIHSILQIIPTKFTSPIPVKSSSGVAAPPDCCALLRLEYGGCMHRLSVCARVRACVCKGWRFGCVCVPHFPESTGSWYTFACYLQLHALLHEPQSCQNYLATQDCSNNSETSKFFHD